MRFGERWGPYLRMRLSCLFLRDKAQLFLESSDLILERPHFDFHLVIEIFEHFLLLDDVILNICSELFKLFAESV